MSPTDHDRRARVSAMLHRPSFLDRFLTKEITLDPFLSQQPDAGRFFYDPGCPPVPLAKPDPDDCPTAPHGDDIGDDATGRRYLYCANCGREYCGSWQHTATRVPPTQDEHQAQPTRHQAKPAPIVLDLSDPTTLADPAALIVRILTVPLITMFQQYGIAQVLEATADALTELARAAQADDQGGEATGPLAALVVYIEQARAYAREKGL